MDPEELQAIEELKAMSREELDQVPYTLVRWQCKVKLCKCFTRVRDYGLHPVYYGPRLKDSEKWFNANEFFFMCSKHYKRYSKRHWQDIPLKKHITGRVVQGKDQRGKEIILL